MDKTVAELLAGKTRTRKNPYVLCWKCMRQRLFLSPWILRRMWSSQLRENFQGAQVPVEQIRKSYRGGY